MGASVIVCDIPAATVLARQAREAEERFRIAFEQAPIGMALIPRAAT